MFTKAFNAIFMTRPFWNEVNVPQSLVLKIYKEYLGTKNMIIGLMRYCCENDRPHPGFVIIDSPLVSLKERKKVSDEWINDYMEKSMIEDIHSQDSSRQVIIFENKDLKYDLDYNYVEFSHEGDGRRGFIP